ncbi:MAG TPA: methyltransferase domain-containing protein [Candidatus Accumulibacter phosphatis]|nr:methyltransferase domain-containing protein [Candidatus Accumulibacter phosphatis]
MLPLVIGPLRLRSVLDVGCGAAAWLAGYRELGVPDLFGVDGDYVDRNMLLIDTDRFIPKDITKSFDLGRQFDLVQCLEVAEHVPRQTSDQLIDNITRHGKRVLFSAAVPGQGGENHINEQPYSFWRDLFEARGFSLFDFVRPRIVGNPSIETWYRYNILFFAHQSVVPDLPAAIVAHRISPSAAIADYSPISYRLRKMILRSLPEHAVSKLAVMKHKRAVRALAQR